MARFTSGFYLRPPDECNSGFPLQKLIPIPALVHILKHSIRTVMGNLLRLLSREPTQEDQEIFVDFESKLTLSFSRTLFQNFFVDAQVTQSEKDVFEQVSASMSQFNLLLDYLRSYRGAEAERRQV